MNFLSPKYTLNKYTLLSKTLSMRTMNVGEFKANFSKVFKIVLAGEDRYIIWKNKEVVATSEALRIYKD